MIRRIRRFYLEPVKIARGCWSIRRPALSQLPKDARENRLSGFAIVRLQGKFGGNGSRETEAMKTFTIAIAMLALIAASGYAQAAGKHERSEDAPKNDAPQKKAEEKAYKAALERIPDPKEKYDPWGVARPAEPAKDTARKPKQVSQ
jgi:hypothetical protein